MDGLSDRGSTPLRSISQRRAKNPGKADIWLVPGIFLLAGNVGYQGLQGCSDNMKGRPCADRNGLSPSALRSPLQKAPNTSGVFPVHTSPFLFELRTKVKRNDSRKNCQILIRGDIPADCQYGKYDCQYNRNNTLYTNQPCTSILHAFAPPDLMLFSCHFIVSLPVPAKFCGAYPSLAISLLKRSHQSRYQLFFPRYNPS